MAPRDGWRGAEKALKTKLPADYLSYAQVYGSGQIICEGVDATTIYNPLAEQYVEWVRRELDSWKEATPEPDEDFEFPIFSEPGGIFPLGVNDNGYTIWFLTEGEPDKWPIVVQGHDDPEFRRFDMPLTMFLATLFTGKKRMPPWPKNWFAKGKRIFFKPGKLSLPKVREYKTIYELYIENGRKPDFWIQDDTMIKEDAYYLITKVTEETAVADVYEERAKGEEDVELDRITESRRYFTASAPPWYKGE